MLLRGYISLVLFFLFNSTYSQEYKSVDSIVSDYPNRFKSSSQLAQRISEDFNTDREKARAVFFWIANNIEYGLEESDKFGFEYSTKSEYDEKLKKHNKKLVKRVISKGVAVCEGYALLFTKVCDELGIQSRVIT